MVAPNKGHKPGRSLPWGEGPRHGAQSLEEPRLGTTSRRAASVANRVPHLPWAREEPHGLPQNAGPCKRQREWPLLYFCPHMVFLQAEDLGWARREAAELKNSHQAPAQACSAVAHHSQGCYMLEGALVTKSVIGRTVVPRLRPFCPDPEAHVPEPC